MSTDPRFAEPTPFARLVYAHASSVAGDACLTVSLAGSLFFQSPTSAARGKVLLYLVLTMAPFAIVAPVLGPAIDRSRAGAGCFVILSAAGRAALCLAMALYISKPAPEGLLVYPLAFGVLVLAKGYSVAKSALVPALVKDESELVTANSRLALAERARGDGGWRARGRRPAALRRRLVAALRRGRVRRRDGPGDPDPTDATSEVRRTVATTQIVEAELHQPSILLAGSAMAVIRGSVGFSAFFAAFSLKHDLFALAVTLGAAARRQDSSV